MTRIVTQIFVRESTETVFDYVTTPAFWPVWHASSIRVDGIDARPALHGERWTELVDAAGHRDLFHWAMTRRVPPHCFTVEGEAGIGKATLTCHFEQMAEGTLLTRELIYVLRDWRLRLMDGLVLARRIRQESRHALLKLQRQLEQAAATQCGAVVTSPITVSALATTDLPA